MTIDKISCSSFIGASLGIGLSVLSLAKGKSIRNINYGNKEVTLISSMSIFGGLLGGVIGDRGNNTKAKVREANQQMFGNIIIPISIMAMCNKLTKHMGTLTRGIIAVTSLFVGTIFGHRVMDKVNGKLFGNEKKYNITANDFLCDVDDGLYAVSTITNNQNIHKAVASIVPLTYIYMGYRAGKVKDSEFDNKLNKII